MKLRRSIALILSIMMVFASVNFAAIGEAFAETAEAVTVIESGTSGKTVTWQLDSEGTLTFSGKGTMTNYTHDTTNDVVSSPFSRNDKIRKVVFEEGITSTGNYLLYDCKSLTEVVLPSTLKTLSAGSLRKCTALEEVAIPESVTSVGGHVFMGDTALKKVNLPKKLTKISDNLFNGCSSLEEIIIPETVTSIGNSSFKGCKVLKEIRIPENVTSLGTNFLQECASIEQVVIPNGVTEIKKSSFYKCRNLKDVTLPQELTTIDASAFYDCDALEYIDIPETVETIGKNAFYGCVMLKKITIPDGVTKIAEQTFSRCSALSEIHIPDSVTSIGPNAFRECVGLIEVELPDSITSIGKEAFRECRYLEKMNMPSNLKELSGFALFNCHLLKEIDLPEGLTTLGQYALYCCNSIKEVTVPKGITTIEQFAFCGCRDLEEVVFLGEVTSIGESAFSGCESLMGLLLPETVNNIGSRAFERCAKLISMVLPNGVTIIEKYTFENCSGLQSVSLSERTTDIDSYAFTGCNSLKSLTIPKATRKIGTNILPEKTKIYCYKDSAAESYAKKMGSPYAYVGGTDADNLITGEIHDDVTDASWSIDRVSGKMTITWNGVFPTYTSSTCPWKDSRANITSVELYGNVNALPVSSFAGCSNMSELTIYNRNCDLSALQLNKGMTIYGFNGSTAERFAKQYGYTFISIDEKHVHDYDDGIQTKASTCWEKGMMKFTCAVCNLETFEEMSVLEHQYTTSSKRATLSEDGYVETACTLCGHASLSLVIPKIDALTLSVDHYVYTGAEQRPDITVSDAQGKVLTPDSDYSFVWTTDGKNAGTHNVMITFSGNYSGSKALSYEIDPAIISSVTLSATEYLYSGTENTPAITVLCGDKTLLDAATVSDVSGVDITYDADRTNVGTYEVCVEGSGNYIGKLTASFEIKPADLAKQTAKLSYTSTTYSGSAKKPTVMIEGLAKDNDYTVSYKDNVNVGTATVTITGKGNYAGTVTETFSIKAADFAKQTAKLSYTSTTYSGSAKKPTVTIKGLKKDTDYTVSYKNNTNAGKATVTIKGKGNYAGTITKTFTIKPKKITAASLGATSYDYNGEAKKPAVTVKSGDKVLMKAKKEDNASVDLTYATGRKNPGTYKVTIKGKGNYTGTITKKFTVKMKGTSLKNVTKGKKQFTATWKKVPSSNITGYQIRYSTTKNFAKYTDVKIKKSTTVSKTVKVKKGGQKYWVKVRTYKVIGNKSYYSTWSEPKSVTPKK